MLCDSVILWLKAQNSMTEIQSLPNLTSGPKAKSELFKEHQVCALASHDPAHQLPAL